MEYREAIKILEKMHTAKVADAEAKEARLEILNAEYSAGDREPDTVAAIKHTTERSVTSRLEAEALSTAVMGLFRLEQLDK
jgi:hypothetical protein